MNRDIELHPCPLCGRPACLWDDTCTWDANRWFPSKVGVTCNACRLSISSEVDVRAKRDDGEMMYGSRDEAEDEAYLQAITRWNRLTAVPEETEEEEE